MTTATRSEQSPQRLNAAPESHQLVESILTQLINRKEALGLSYAQLGKLLGVSRAATFQILRVGKAPTIPTLVAYAKAMGCRLSMELEEH